ncbi:hypothetical protein K435DRAFT_843964 [Dendrothele bispora CBS 962.96]|uniref:Uncharacterized protein n=1 Tax=Dendrothele bispora (strain CBS 962.96) TaxID=1314807 RepID=A0A4S8L4X1_DENBC|nr:hypothetical protein K435DRAFT_843964 [Dendrothele bispora CBS 962.96]
MGTKYESGFEVENECPKRELEVDIAGGRGRGRSRKGFEQQGDAAQSSLTLSKHSISLLKLEMSHAYSRDNIERPSNLRATINQAITYSLNSILTKHQVLLLTHRKENGINSLKNQNLYPRKATPTGTINHAIFFIKVEH